jgi:DNA-binding NtrC family response regulator
MAFVLLIDDDRTLQSALRTQLVREGHTVRVAATLEDAVAQLAEMASQGTTRPHEHSDEPIVPLEEVEFLMVRRALRAANGNQSQAARLLRVSRDQLRYRVKRYREAGKLTAELAGESV